MTQIDLAALFAEHFPNAKDCIDGHIGEPVASLEKEIDDDRYYEITVHRCSHCNIPLSQEYV
jgi:hypothetical protein